MKNLNNNTTEEFKSLSGYEGIYEVSNIGRVKSLKRKGRLQDKILHPSLSRGYKIVALTNRNKKLKFFGVHQLVAMAFLNHIPSGHDLVCDHINLNRSDNRVENIRIVSNRQNTSHKKKSSSSEYTGVSWYKQTGKWMCHIMMNKKVKHLGYFTNEIDAHNKYQEVLSNFLKEE